MSLLTSKTNNSLKDDQRGLVSILVTIMIMIVITLIVLTFAKIIRREQRQALDRQLNTQAFYAAESGINDAVKAINGGFKAPKPDCAPFSGIPNPATNPAELQNSDVDGPNGVSYTCLTVNPTPTSLVFDNVDFAKQSTIIPVISTAANPLTEITLSWETPGKTNYTCDALVGNDAFPPAASPACDNAVLRVDIIPGNVLKRSDMLNANKTLFLIPNNGGGNTKSYGGTISGDKYGVKCPVSGAPKACQVTINSLTSSSSYYLRIRSIYANASVTITAKDSTGSVKLKDAQAIVDSTGKANDVLRRVQVRVPLQKVTAPDYAIQSNDTICKRLKVNGANVLPDLPGIPTATPAGNTSPVDTAPCSP